eukprot:TRINITY_DN37648_c0_g1_i1.p1 TRINITY_DN37648_c0_g1~~TRINITY_DN37648_c0_g1_i1.p1  ORF type:complete len:170 (+),score=37.09 TRINITY_DN37648_c0_g1_i1:110-619(+)
MWSHVSKLAIFGCGGVAGASAATIIRSRERKVALEAGEYYELNGRYYQALGHAWDHFRRDFCIVYRPLYNCAASQNFEAHLLATSHFERFQKFGRVDFAALSAEAKAYALPGPFWEDRSWGLPTETAPVPGADAAKNAQRSAAAALEAARTPTSCGYGTRSHQTYSESS